MYQPVAPVPHRFVATGQLANDAPDPPVNRIHCGDRIVVRSHVDDPPMFEARRVPSLIDVADEQSGGRGVTVLRVVICVVEQIVVDDVAERERIED